MQTRENLTDISYADDAALQLWPMDSAAIRRDQTMRVVRPNDRLWRPEGRETPALVRILSRTEHLCQRQPSLDPFSASEC